jgi:CBS domain-containing protein
MKVHEVMEHDVARCRRRESLLAAAMAMDDAECGALPVLDEQGAVVGVITDRDICLALARRDQRPSRVEVGDVMHGPVRSCAPGDEVGAALETMRRWRVRRLPVVEGGRLVGLVALDGLVLHAQTLQTHDFSGPLFADIAATLREVCEPRAAVVL